MSPTHTRAAFLVLAIPCTACSYADVDRVLPAAGFGRNATYGDHDWGSAEIRVAGELVPGDQVHVPVEIFTAVDDRTSLFVEWLPVGFKERDDGWDVSSSGEITYGLHQRIARPDPLSPGLPALTAVLFAVSPHGGPKPARWPGVIEGEEGYFAVGGAEWSSSELSFGLNLGTGVGGRPASTGHSGRILAGAGLTWGLAPTGIGFSTEPTRLGLETFWVRDPVDDRTFGELHAGLSFWVGVTEIDLGYRRGLTDDTVDNVFYVGFRARMFDTLSL